MSKTAVPLRRERGVYRIGINRLRWRLRVPRWFALKVWLWLPGEWHNQMTTWSRRPGPILTRGLGADWWGCLECRHRAASWDEYDDHKATHGTTR